MSDDPAVDAVFWDIGGVILDVDSVQAAHREFVATLVTEYPTEHSTTEALDIWRTTVGEYFREREGTEFRPAREAYDLAVGKILAEPVDAADWKATFDDALAATVRPNADAVAAIERLADVPIHQGVVSDVDDEEGKWLLEHFGVREHFDAVTTSEAVGRTKPDPAMFETALEKAGVDPERSVMIGDRYEHDVRGSAKLGMTAVGYGLEEGDDADYLVEDLRELPGLLGLEN
jgi:putative hydrolase of the HAD superfamily